MCKPTTRAIRRKREAEFTEKILALSGQDRLNAQKTAATDLEAIRQRHKDMLGNLDSQLLYESQTTPFFNRSLMGQRLYPSVVQAGKK